MSEEPREITELLISWQAGDQEALNKIMPLLYDELRRISRAQLRKEKPGHTLQATALVNEVYMKMVDQNRTNWQSRAHFLSVAANVMRRILVDYWHHKNRQKRGGDAIQVTLSDLDQLGLSKDTDLEALNEGLEALEAFDPRKARLVELKFFGGLNIDEIAEVLDISQATVGRDWKAARAWLHAFLKKHKAETGE